MLAIWAAQTSRRGLLLVMLALTMLFGCTFLGIKGIEYKDKFEEHHVPGASFSFDHVPIPGHPDQFANPQHAQIFFALYFIMTGLHALHMIIGLGLFAWLFWMAWKGRFTPEYHTPLEIGGLYWHFVDIVWIYLFPPALLDRPSPVKLMSLSIKINLIGRHPERSRSSDWMRRHPERSRSSGGAKDLPLIRTVGAPPNSEAHHV